MKFITQGIDFLAKKQQKDGSFLIYSTSDRRSFRNAKTYHSTFPTALILSCLNSVKQGLCHSEFSDDQLKRAQDDLVSIQNKAAKFLFSQKSNHWSFNYWIKGSKETRTIPYPDDLDDTFCALSALFQYNPELISASAMAKIVTLLTAVEKEEGGPYYTWLVPQDAEKVWKDVDLAVNSNIAYFLSLHDVFLPKLSKFIELSIDAEDFHSPYYPSVYPIIYFISRFYKNKKAKKQKSTRTKNIIKFLLAMRDRNHKWENPLNTALTVSSLLNLGSSPEKVGKSISYLLERLQAAGHRPQAYPFCLDPAIDKKRYYAGSSALTTAFCLEALAKYSQKLKIPQTRVSSVQGRQIKNAKSIAQKCVYNQVVKQVKQRFSKLDDDFKKQALTTLKKTLRRDKDKQIVLMPYFFKISLGKNREKITNDFLIKLGLSNLYGWMAYTIYDDFLDDEGDPKLLSVANLCLRELTTIFNQALPEKKRFKDFFCQFMDRIDSVNTWEVSHCRFNPKKAATYKLKKIPDYGNFSKLADKSIGHALGPAAILFSLGYDASSSEVKNLMLFFQHFLIARQLNDDAHDWEKDLKMGHLNAVGAEILEKVKSNKTYNLQATSYKLYQQVFWYKVVVDVCQVVIKHVELARKALEKVSLVCDASLFEKLLMSIENSAKKALKERKETLIFLKTYSTP